MKIINAVEYFFHKIRGFIILLYMCEYEFQYKIKIILHIYHISI